MPTLHWIGREAVINHHNEIPYRLLRWESDLSVGDVDAGNLLVEGDNLEALKALLPYYAGKVKCIYIDPPYNTGNEDWVYSDSVSSTQMRAWLGKVVGLDDLSRHDKWLCMMYPRLKLLWELLSDEGSLWMSIDDNEIHYACAILNEIFGKQKPLAIVVWEKIYSPKSSAQHLSANHDFILLYAKNPDRWRRNLLPRTERQDKRYRNLDNDPRGPWKPSGLDARNPYSEGIYPIVTPSGRLVPGPPKGSYWRVSEEKLKELDTDGRIWWGEDGSNVPAIKRFLSEVRPGIVPQTIWPYSEVGHTQEAKQEVVRILPDAAQVFSTPKPTRLIQRILQIATDPGDIILDSFAGSGTTGHAVLQMNKEDGGNRRFILVELESDIARNITAERLRRAIEGYKFTGTERTSLFEEKITITTFKRSSRILEEIESIKEAYRDEYDGFETRIENERVVLYGKSKIESFREGLGGGFRYCTLGPPLLDEVGTIRPEVSFQDMGAHIYFTETGEPLPERLSKDSPLVGKWGNTAYYLLFNGVRGDNLLNMSALRHIRGHSGPAIVYADGCTLSETLLKQYQITFKQIPYEVATR
jgi:adenine-specific DNA-methyltransferase